MTSEELFKKNYPEYVTKKGECLSPYWDLFSAGIECATDELNKGCIQTLTKENAELKERLLKVENAYKRKSEAEWRLSGLYQKVLTDFANAEKCSRLYFTRYITMLDFYIKAKDILQRLMENQPTPSSMYEEIDLIEWRAVNKEAEQFLKEE